MSLSKRLLRICMLVFLLSFPFRFADPAIPDKPIFEYVGDGKIELFNTHSNELMQIRYKDEKGKYLDMGIQNIDHILRCRMTGEVKDMSLKLIELVDHIQDHFGEKRVEIISGYRSPTLNGELRSQGRGVAKRSLHMEGLAMDIRIPGVSSRELRDYAASLHAGGVGHYPGPNFVHVDVGRVRTW